MSVTELKEKLHNQIDKIDDLNSLEEILSIIESRDSKYALTLNEISMLEERHERFLKGEEKEMTIDELKKQISNKHGF